HYIHPDHLDTPRAITDSANKVIWRWDSDPFGTTAANEDPDGDKKKFSYNLRFPGQYFDKETGLHYNYFRDYDPRVGRYVQSDPIGLAGGLNTYTYVGNNPLSLTDPLGLRPNGGSGGGGAGSGSSCSEDNEKRCEEVNKIDTATCNAITRKRGAMAGAACHASASQRYAACLRGQPLPPLNTWNNREGVEPNYPDTTTPNEPPKVPSPPWWIIPLLPVIQFVFG
ncbi:MAG: RHS repeat domain-containing protein, partial [Pseudomonadota bacterium]